MTIDQRNAGAGYYLDMLMQEIKDTAVTAYGASGIFSVQAKGGSAGFAANLSQQNEHNRSFLSNIDSRSPLK